jgi:hypothetical protein
LRDEALQRICQRLDALLHESAIRLCMLGNAVCAGVVSEYSIDLPGVDPLSCTALRRTWWSTFLSRHVERISARLPWPHSVKCPESFLTGMVTRRGKVIHLPRRQAPPLYRLALRLLGVGAGRARNEFRVFVFVELFVRDKGAARNCWVRNQHSAAISSSVPRSSIRIIRQAYKRNLCWVSRNECSAD